MQQHQRNHEHARARKTVDAVAGFCRVSITEKTPDLEEKFRTGPIFGKNRFLAKKSIFGKNEI